MGIREVSLPIFAGILQGKQYVLWSKGKLVRVLMGTYEPALTAIIAETLKPGQVFWDIGAHAGYYALVAAGLVGDGGEIIAFEPSPRNVHYLKMNMERNHIETVRVVQKAVAGEPGTVTFEAGTGTGTGSLHADGEGIRVEVITLDDFVRENPGVRMPDAVKIDVEGAEFGLLQGAEKVFGETKPVLFLSTHGPAVYRQCLDWLDAHGYVSRLIVGTGEEKFTSLLCVAE